MQELDDNSQFDMIAALVTAGPGTEKDQEGPKPFSAGVNQIGRDFLNQGDMRSQAFLYKLIYSTEM